MGEQGGPRACCMEGTQRGSRGTSERGQQGPPWGAGRVLSDLRAEGRSCSGSAALRKGVTLR